MKEAAQIVGILFVSRDQAHREHLKTTSYAQHVALGDFYESVIDLADSFAEVYQGNHGILDVPYIQPAKGSIDDILEHHIATIESLKQAFKSKQDSALLNIVDEISALYSKTLYKLRNLK